MKVKKTIHNKYLIENINDLIIDKHTLVISHLQSDVPTLGITPQFLNNLNKETMHYDEEKKVFRSFALPLASFDYLKSFQRNYQMKHKVEINNNQTLAILLAQHKQLNVENEEYELSKIKNNCYILR